MKQTKTFLSLLLFSLLMSTAVYAQWEPTSLKSNYDIIEHNNTVYASSGRYIFRLNKSTQKWDTLQSTGRTAYDVHRMASNGPSLFIRVQYQGCASSMIYRSDDNGTTFVEDSVGFPVNTWCDKWLVNIYNLETVSGCIVAGISTGRYIRKPNSPRWTSIEHPVKFSDLFAEHNGTIYGYYNKFYKSTDTCSTWETAGSVGLNHGGKTRFLFVIPSTGRIYLGGGTQMFFSDDEGENWDTVAIKKHLVKNWIGESQEIYAALGSGNDIYLVLDNDKGGSHPDVLHSSDNGLTFAPDTVGLPANAGPTVLPRKILYSNNVLYLGLDYNGVFTKGSATSGIKNYEESLIKVYPNPSNSFFNISNEIPLKRVEIYTLTGALINIMEQSQDLHSFTLPFTGMFIVRITDTDNKQHIQRIIKN